MPGTLVEIGLNSPRMPSGGRGLHVPHIQTTGPAVQKISTHESALGSGPVTCAAALAQHFRQRETHQPQTADLQHLAAQNDRAASGPQNRRVRTRVAHAWGRVQRAGRVSSESVSVAGHTPCAVAVSFGLRGEDNLVTLMSLTQIDPGIDFREDCGPV